MTTELLVKKLNKEVGHLRKDMFEIKKLVLAQVTDSEGKYRSSFVKKVLKRSKEKPIYRFTTKENFLKKLHAKGK